MKESIVNAFNSFQIADFDDDLVGIGKAFIDWIQVIRKELGEDSLPDPGKLENFYKLDPHLPRQDLRTSLRESLGNVVYKQESDDLSLKLKNLFITVVAGTYVYHLPTEEIIKAGYEDKEFSRDELKNILLTDNMSPNWIKEPSGKDFSKIMI